MNQVTRSMGEPDFYPFVPSRPAIQKLHFVHRVIQSSSEATLQAVATQQDASDQLLAA